MVLDTRKSAKDAEKNPLMNDVEEKMKGIHEQNDSEAENSRLEDSESDQAPDDFESSSKSQSTPIRVEEVKAKKSKAKTLKEDTRYKKMKIETKMYFFGDIYANFVIPLYLFSSFCLFRSSK